MRYDRLNRWLTLAANVGVLVGILLLVAELNQNRQMMRAQIRHELSNTIVDLLRESAANNQLASVMRRALVEEALSPDELLQFGERQWAIFRYWEDVHYQYRHGLYEPSEYARQRDAWRAYINQSAAVAQEWCAIRTLVASPFATEVDSLLTDFHC